MRLFAGLHVSPQFIRQAAALPRKGMDSARFVHPDDLHITLRFIGDAPDEKHDEIKNILSGVRMKQFSIVARGLGAFTQKSQAALYAPIESHKKITHLSAEITDRLNKIGFEFPIREFTPHITLARLKNTQGLEQYIERNKKAVHAEWAADKFYLFKSADPESEGGARYSVLQEYALTAY